MPYTFEAVGWEDFEGDRHKGTPSDIADTHGVLVDVTNPDDPDDFHRFWVWAGGDYEDWAQWWVLIGAVMEHHGMELA